MNFNAAELEPTVDTVYDNGLNNGEINDLMHYSLFFLFFLIIIMAIFFLFSFVTDFFKTGSATGCTVDDLQPSFI